MSGHFELFQNKKRQWYARFRAANGKIIWRVSEGYNRRRDVIRAIKAVAGDAIFESASLERKGDVWVLT